MTAKLKSSLIDLDAWAQVTGRKVNYRRERLSERTSILMMRQSGPQRNAESESCGGEIKNLPALETRSFKVTEPQFADAKDATMQGLGKGDTFHWNIFSDVATAGTTLNETTAMPETNFTISQGTLTIGEYGNSVPYTGVLDDLSEQPVKEIIRKVLVNDAKKAIDSAAHAQFKLAPLRVVATATTGITLTTNGTATATNSIALGTSHVKYIVDTMKERNIPAYMNDDYYAIAWPSTFRTFKDNLEALSVYTETGFSHIMNGEVGRYEGTRFVEQTNIAKYTGSTANTTWTNGKSDWCFFLGELIKKVRNFFAPCMSNYAMQTSLIAGNA